MGYRSLHAVEDFVKNPLSREKCSNRNVSARQRFCKENHIRLDVPVFNCQEAAGAAQSGLHFIRDEQGAVAPAEIRGKFEIIIVGDVYPLALDRLDDECGNVTRMKRPLKRATRSLGHLADRWQPAILLRYLNGALG